MLHQLQLEHLNEEESFRIQQICLYLSGIFYLEGDNLSVINDMKHVIDINNAESSHTKSYYYGRLHGRYYYLFPYYL